MGERILILLGTGLVIIALSVAAFFLALWVMTDLLGW
jgi:hypothetical protein